MTPPTSPPHAAGRERLAAAGFGLALGVVLSASGVTDPGELRRMFTLGVGQGGPGWEDLRLLLAFAGAAILSVAGFRALARHDELPPAPVRAGTVPGAILLGAGWVLAGACPGSVLVQLGEGRGDAVLALAGMLAGIWLHEVLRRRRGWARHACTD